MDWFANLAIQFLDCLNGLILHTKFYKRTTLASIGGLLSHEIDLFYFSKILVNRQPKVRNKMECIQDACLCWDSQ